MYKFLTNRLPINSRLSHYVDTPSECTFCLVNYDVSRGAQLGEASGPVMLPKETQMHLFFGCNSVRSALAGTEWNSIAALQPVFENKKSLAIKLRLTVEILMQIWSCKMVGVTPTRSRLGNDIW